MKHLLLAGLIAWACGSALPVVAVAQAEHAVETAAIDPSWLQFDTATQAVSFQLIAGLTGLNGALNFNGFRDGGLTLTVPLGSNVVLHFRNHDGMLPHSAEVIADTHPLPPGPVAPAFARALTVRLEQGLISEHTDDIRFIADRGGSHLILCAVSRYGERRMWVRRDDFGASRQRSVATGP